MQNRNHALSRNRRGLSILELFGCLTALGGGLALGLMYLGFDLKSVAMEAKEYAETNEFLVSTFSLASNEHASDAGEGDLAEVASVESSNEEQTTDGESVEEQADATEEPVEVAESNEIANEAENTFDSSEEESDTATQAYWQTLTQAMRVENAARDKFKSRTGNWQLFDFLNYRKESHEVAVAALEALENTNVDRNLLHHTQQVLAWQRSGVQLYSRAVELLTDSPNSSMAGPAAQSWQSAATQHQMEEKLILGKHRSMAGYLNNTYKSVAPFTPASSR